MERRGHGRNVGRGGQGQGKHNGRVPHGSGVGILAGNVAAVVAGRGDINRGNINSGVARGGRGCVRNVGRGG